MEKIEDSIIDKIKRIKYTRMSGIEQSFLHTIKGMTSEKEGDMIYWYSENGTVIFEYKIGSNLLIVNYDMVWNFYSYILEMSDFEIRKHIKSMSIKYLGRNEFILPIVKRKKTYKYTII